MRGSGLVRKDAVSELTAHYVPRVCILCAGDRYVVVDCGGGTVDLTVHQIRLPEGHLKELYKASGKGGVT